MVRISDTLKQQNNLTSFPVAYAEDLWINRDTSGETEDYTTIQNAYNNGELGGSSIQVDTMPIASSEYEGAIYQYIGDSGTYKKNAWYECIEDSENVGTYIWNYLNIPLKEPIIMNEQSASTVQDALALIVNRDSGTGAPVGTLISQYKKVPMSGYLYCDGSTFDETAYPSLYLYLGSNVLPDYRECVMVGAEQNTTDTIAAHDVYTEGQFKDDQFQDHTHSVSAVGLGHTEYYDGSAKYLTTSTSTGKANSGRYGTTTHGKQKAVYVYIKATSGLAENQQENVLNATKNYVDNANSYSTEETLTGGTWIDGKPIYRKCFNGSWTVPNSTWSDIITVPNIEQLIRAEIMANNNMWSGYWEIANSNVRFYTSNGTIFKLCILEYTKTTD